MGKATFVSPFAPLASHASLLSKGVQMFGVKSRSLRLPLTKQCPRAHNPHTDTRSSQTMVARKVSLVTGELSCGVQMMMKQTWHFAPYLLPFPPTRRQRQPRQTWPWWPWQVAGCVHDRGHQQERRRHQCQEEAGCRGSFHHQAPCCHCDQVREKGRGSISLISNGNAAVVIL